MLRIAWIYVVAAWLTFYHSSRVVIASSIGSKRLSQVGDTASRRWSNGILWAAGVGVTVHGLENLDADHPQIIVANHQSWFDVFALAARLPVETRFATKEELSHFPIFGAAWVAAGHILINRGDRDQAIESLRIAGEQIHENGKTLVMFAEGTRSLTGELQRFKKGAFHLAIQAQVPVVPVAVLGSRDIMPKGSWRVGRGHIVIRIGEPIPVEELVHEQRDQLRERVWRAVAELMGKGRESDKLHA